MSALLFSPGFPFSDSNGDPASAGTVTFYDSGTTTLKTVYSNSTLTTALANPQTLTAAGRLSTLVYSSEGEAYTVEAKDSAGAALPGFPADNVWGTNQSPTPFIAVQRFGATGDGVTDDTAAIQSAINYVIANGGRVYLPAGEYVCSDRLEWIETSDTHDEYTKGGIVGDGPGSSVIRWTGTTTATTGIQITSSSTTTFNTFFHIKDIRLMNNISTRPGTGLQIDNMAFCYFENIYVTGFEYGINATDMLSCTLQGCFIRLNEYGMKVSRSDLGAPNALTLNGCNFANREWGIYLDKPSTFTMNGGAVEGNGFTGVETDKWGVRIDDGASGGASACTFNSVYFEKTVGKADVWIDQDAGANPCTYNFYGCTFNRIDVTEFCTNNIFADVASGDCVVNVNGCGFRGFNDYSPNSARKYVGFVEAGGNIRFNGSRAQNHYDSTLEDPTTNTLTGPGAVSTLHEQTFIVTTGVDAYTLADGIAGERIFILMTGHGGNGTLTPTSLGGGTTITFSAAGQFAVLEWRNADWWMTGGTAALA